MLLFLLLLFLGSLSVFFISLYQRRRGAFKSDVLGACLVFELSSFPTCCSVQHPPAVLIFLGQFFSCPIFYLFLLFSCPGLSDFPCQVLLSMGGIGFVSNRFCGVQRDCNWLDFCSCECCPFSLSFFFVPFPVRTQPFSRFSRREAPTSMRVFFPPGAELEDPRMLWLFGYSPPSNSHVCPRLASHSFLACQPSRKAQTPNCGCFVILCGHDSLEPPTVPLLFFPALAVLGKDTFSFFFLIIYWGLCWIFAAHTLFSLCSRVTLSPIWAFLGSVILPSLWPLGTFLFCPLFKSQSDFPILLGCNPWSLYMHGGPIASFNEQSQWRVRGSPAPSLSCFPQVKTGSYTRLPFLRNPFYKFPPCF